MSQGLFLLQLHMIIEDDASGGRHTCSLDPPPFISPSTHILLVPHDDLGVLLDRDVESAIVGGRPTDFMAADGAEKLARLGDWQEANSEKYAYTGVSDRVIQIRWINKRQGRVACQQRRICTLCATHATPCEEIQYSTWVSQRRVSTSFPPVATMRPSLLMLHMAGGAYWGGGGHSQGNHSGRPTADFCLDRWSLKIGLAEECFCRKGAPCQRHAEVASSAAAL